MLQLAPPTPFGRIALPLVNQTQNGHCRDFAFERCMCAFHRLETERRVRALCFRA